MKFMCFGLTLSYPHKEFLNPRLPSARTKYNPHPQCGPSPAGGASGALPPRLKSVPPFHVWLTGCCIHPILQFENVAPLRVFCPPCCFILATGLTRTRNSAGARTRPANAGTRNPRGLTRPAQDFTTHGLVYLWEKREFWVNTILN